MSMRKQEEAAPTQNLAYLPVLELLVGTDEEGAGGSRI